MWDDLWILFRVMVSVWKQLQLRWQVSAACGLSLVEVQGKFHVGFLAWHIQNACPGQKVTTRQALCLLARWTQVHKKLQSLLTVCISLFFSVPLCSFTHDIPKQLSKMRDIISVTHEKTAVMDSLNAFIAFWTPESPGQCHKSPRWPPVSYFVWDSPVRPACV